MLKNLAVWTFTAGAGESREQRAVLPGVLPSLRGILSWTGVQVGCIEKPPGEKGLTGSETHAPSTAHCCISSGLTGFSGSEMSACSRKLTMCPLPATNENPRKLQSKHQRAVSSRQRKQKEFYVDPDNRLLRHGRNVELTKGEMDTLNIQSQNSSYINKIKMK